MKEMGVINWCNVCESIEGGVCYFKKLYCRLFEEVVELNWIWFVLVVYNVGYGYLMDVRCLVKSEGVNFDNWFDVWECLLLLWKCEYYLKMWYGFVCFGV